MSGRRADSSEVADHQQEQTKAKDGGDDPESDGGLGWKKAVRGSGGEGGRE